MTLCQGCGCRLPTDRKKKGYCYQCKPTLAYRRRIREEEEDAKREDYWQRHEPGGKAVNFPPQP